MNPSFDPSSKSRRGGGRPGIDTRRRSHKRYREDPDEEDYPSNFDENMYDDDPASLAARISRPLQRSAPTKRRRRSEGEVSSGDEGMGYREENDERRARNAGRGDLFSRTSGYNSDRSRASVKASTSGQAESYLGRLRDRSASPLRDGDGRLGFAEEGVQRPTARQRSQTPPALRARMAEKAAVNGMPNGGRDLFERVEGQGLGVLGVAPASNGAGFEPKSRRTPSKELFPTKMNGSPMGHHRRSDAIDAHDDSIRGSAAKTRDLFARIGDANGGRSLAERITSGPAVDVDEREGFSIRGGGRGANPGFAIKGMGANHAKVRELFPEKTGGGEREKETVREERDVGGGGRDLFEGRLKGGRRRLGAEDLFA